MYQKELPLNIRSKEAMYTHSHIQTLLVLHVQYYNYIIQYYVAT